MEEESKSIFVEYFGDSPYIRVLDFMIEGQLFDYSMTEIARGAGVGWGSFRKIWINLLNKRMVIQTRVIGNAKLFRLNKDNPIVQKLVKFDVELTKMVTDQELEKEILAS